MSIDCTATILYGIPLSEESIEEFDEETDLDEDGDPIFRDGIGWMIYNGHDEKGIR